ncbi:flagellar filament capping protein FliD [Alkalihalobacillus sp. LMS39]|uniref:flagellar filament capping protein FliD n=1 Tax=Alkalihalobacillus sp. LMS39 TaxID=2924032 RepID=UPI001FB5141A|nr:flagellar filament capping protein FliD [Alkalihalobacillus sp. LMS39]UOE93801.1 flagellar filament capping protein FliD [Alkalihalobacillus sp. LMS39]
MRFSGLASGMDTESIVRDLMRVRRIPVDRMMQQKQVFQWQMDSYRDVNRKFGEFRNNIVDNMLLTSANLRAKTAVSSNDARVSATASASAGNVSYRITEVSKLATAASTFSSSAITTGSKLDTTKSIMSQRDSFANGIEWKEGIVERQSFKAVAGQMSFQLDPQKAANIKTDYTNDMVVKVNGKVFNVVDITGQGSDGLGPDQVGIDYSTGTLRFAQGMTSNADVSVTYFREDNTQTLPASVSAPRQNFQLANGSIDLQSLTLTVGDKEFTANGDQYKIVTNINELNENSVFVNVDTGAITFHSAQTQSVQANYKQMFATAGVTTHNATGPVQDKFVFEGRTTLNQMMNTMNNSPVGISMFYDPHTDSIAATRKVQGLYNKTGDQTEMSFEGSFFTQALKLDSRGSQGAQNATFIINGLETERNSNTFTLSGVTFTLKETFLATENAAPINISVNTNTDKIMDTIKDFVNRYNELIEMANGLMSENRQRSFQPLTDEQKEAMSEKEIEQWEEKAKSGLLRNDPLISNALTRLRSDVFSPVTTSGPFNQLAQIGITTSRDYMSGGKLEINEDRLRQAIERDPDGVANLFTADGEGSESQGIVRRMRDSLDHAMTTIAQRAGGSRGFNQSHQFTLGRNINSLDSRIDNMERRMKQIEDRYWKQFSAMESAMMRANQQAETMFAQLFSNQG